MCTSKTIKTVVANGKAGHSAKSLKLTLQCRLTLSTLESIYSCSVGYCNLTLKHANITNKNETPGMGE